MDCTSPPVVDYGYVSYESLGGGPTWTDGTDITYKCFKWFGLVGSSKLTCSSGTWSGTMPQCEWNNNTEIVFWCLIAVVVLLLLLLMALLIFVCCYFGRCCGHGKGKKGLLGDG
ncbi:C4b-binding protein alpha chain-like [Mercenaria mercenaria]|uniref:C4b-binding protein alpha chain-like n=1 Tax=Mercenaria mercenaria TaxID=6596 RepID=UPI00234EA31D|nr:C4b-binding protein alpha chain-like [Mercenaria mercenaria]XP_045165509.2 C4b-binding protein alpha chain-like [Mercenaria mercenaria]